MDCVNEPEHCSDAVSSEDYGMCCVDVSVGRPKHRHTRIRNFKSSLCLMLSDGGRVSGGSKFGCWSLLIGWSCSDRRGLTPQSQPTDSSVRADDETNVTDRSAQSQLGLAVQMSVMRTELQHRRDSRQEVDPLK